MALQPAHLFLISGLLRGLVAATVLGHISEVRQVPKTTAAELLFGWLDFARVGVNNISQPVFHLVSRLNVESVPFISHWTSAWRPELVTASRSPPI